MKPVPPILLMTLDDVVLGSGYGCNYPAGGAMPAIPQLHPASRSPRGPAFTLTIVRSNFATQP